MSLNFDLPKDQSSIIKVFGVGGGGSNAVNHMFKQGIKGVDFVICNTDQQALDVSPVPNKIQLGATLTEGRGAGAKPEVGKNAAIEDIERIKEILEKNTKMVFITAGMGGGTGTGAAPVIAKTAKDMGILTVGIVTMPFVFEGRRRKQQAESGIEELRNCVDTLLIINNDKIREIYGNLKFSDAFGKADDVLTTASKGIAEIITVTGYVNVDFEDVRTVMSDSGVAIMGSGIAEGEGRAIKAVQSALASPLLNDNEIVGANYVLLNITSGVQELSMDEMAEITDYIQEAAGFDADVIWGNGTDESLGDSICVTVIATGFESNPDTGLSTDNVVVKKVVSLEEERPITLTSPFLNETTKVEEEIKEPLKNTVRPSHFSEPKVEEINATFSSEEEPYLKNSEIENPKVQEPIDLFASAPKVEDIKSSSSIDQFEAKNELEEESQTITGEDPMMPYLKTSTGPTEEKNIEQPANESKPNNTDEPYLKQEPSQDQRSLQQRALDRINKLKEIHLRIKSPSGISDLESEPAYKRRNIDLDNVPHSSESQASRFSLNEETDSEGNKRTGLSDNNSFLHDNVD